MLQRVSAAKVVHQVRGYYQSWRGRRSCIICRRHWSDYGQTYNIQKTAILASWLFLFYLQFPRSLRHSFSAYEHESSRPARDNDMAQPNMILLHDWLVSVSLPTLLGYQRASAFVNATKLASQPLFSFAKNKKYRTFYRTHFLLISITCLSRYISLSFYRPALPWTTKAVIRVNFI